eukprot:scaffold41996_cov32-Prasinocladus_malaysianus.AAC.2
MPSQGRMMVQGVHFAAVQPAADDNDAPILCSGELSKPVGEETLRLKKLLRIGYTTFALHQIHDPCPVPNRVISSRETSHDILQEQFCDV